MAVGGGYQTGWGRLLLVTNAGGWGGGGGSWGKRGTAVDGPLGPGIGCAPGRAASFLAGGVGGKAPAALAQPTKGKGREGVW